jgi:hypothetical protein
MDSELKIKCNCNANRAAAVYTAKLCYKSVMPHTIAKELKDAGFPNIQDVQHRQGREFVTPDGRVSVYSVGEIAPTEDWFIPTLKELIEACEKKKGCDHFILEHSQLGWFATVETQDKQTYSGSFQPTAEAAVARLWLALKRHGETI